MDINNYSYCNTSNKNNIIASCEKGISGYPVFFELCLNWFNDRFYYVYDLFGKSEEYPISSYSEAARFYNSLVPHNECIPLF